VDSGEQIEEKEDKEEGGKGGTRKRKKRGPQSGYNIMKTATCTPRYQELDTHALGKRMLAKQLV